MKNRMKDESISDFLLNPRFRRHRHVLLQIIVFLITINVLWYEPLLPLFTGRRIGGWVVYFCAIDIVIYSNIYWLVPRLLLKNKLFLYFLSSLAVVFTVIVITVICQGLLYTEVVFQGELYTETGPHNTMGTFAMLLNAFSGIFTVGLVSAGSSAILLLRYWIRHGMRINELQTMTLQSELKYLKNQINPHFLFNMLNNANVLVKRNPEEASKVLFKLEDLLRYQMNDSSRERVALVSDIHFLNDFLNLEKIRRDKFEYSIRQEGKIDSIRIQPLLFIPFVENAVKHNFDSEGSSYVRLSFVVQKQRLTFQCENSKPMVVTDKGNDKKKVVGGIGLVNIRRRLELLYSGRYLLEIAETERIYTVILRLDL